MSEPIIFERQVPGRCAGQRLDQAAGELLPEYSRSRVQRWIREGALTVDGKVHKPSSKVGGGEVLRLKAEPARDGEVIAQEIPLTIIFEDEDILVLNKPAGLVVHPAAGHADGTLQNGLLFHRPELGELPRGGIVHRLDKDTTGVMVVAASLRAHSALVAQLQARTMSRIYECIALGKAGRKGTVDAPIARHPQNRVKMAVVEGGKPAISHYRRLTAFAHFSHLEVSLESGRTHQIRVHMQHLGFPLAADPLYGRSLKNVKGLGAEVRMAVEGLGRQALHARTLRLTHPGSGEEQVFSAPLAQDVGDLLGVLAAHDASE